MTITEGPTPTPDPARSDEDGAWGCVWWWWIIAILVIVIIIWAGWGWFGVGGRSTVPPPGQPDPSRPVVPTTPPPTPRV